MKKIYKVIVLILFALVLLIPATAFGQMSLGTIQNAVESEESRKCEYISLENAVLPLRLFVQFPTTPDVTPIIHGEHPSTQFASDFGNDYLNFSTNSTDLFTIQLNLGYEFEDTLPRNFFYELITKDGENRQVGSWQITDTDTCKVIELNARPPVHILTEQEIIENIAQWEQEQHALTQSKQDATNDLITIIVIVVVAVGFIFFIIILFMKFTKSKDTKNAEFASVQLATTIGKLNDLAKFLKTNDFYRDTKVDYIITSIDKSLDSIMHGMKLHNKVVKESAFKPRKAMPDKTEKEQEDESMSKASKMFETVKSALIETKPKVNLGTKYEKFNELTNDEIYNKITDMDKEYDKFKNNAEWKSERDVLMKIYKERNDQQ